jgi:hypothetical protein
MARIARDFRRISSNPLIPLDFRLLALHIIRKKAERTGNPQIAQNWVRPRTKGLGDPQITEVEKG